MKHYLLFVLALTIAGCSPATAVVPDPTATNQADAAKITEREANATDTPVAEKGPTSTGLPSPTGTESASGAASSPEVPLAETEVDHNDLLRGLLLEVNSLEEAQSILAQIRKSGDTRFVAGLIDVLRYQRGLSVEISATLSDLTGAQDVPPEWHDWVEWAGKHPELESFAAYDRWKASLFSLIDPNFSRFIYSGVKVAPGSRLEEIVWGGVRVDGIPALDNPKMIDPGEADYLVPQERVFGVSINGDTRAYPARFLDWHEMFNDVVGDEAVSLAY